MTPILTAPYLQARGQRLHHACERLQRRTTLQPHPPPSASASCCCPAAAPFPLPLPLALFITDTLSSSRVTCSAARYQGTNFSTNRFRLEKWGNKGAVCVPGCLTWRCQERRAGRRTRRSCPPCQRAYPFYHHHQSPHIK